MILPILKATEEYRCTQTRSGAPRTERFRCTRRSTRCTATCGRAEPGLWMRGRLQIKNGTGSRAALISSIPLIHRGVPRQVARRAWSVSFRLGLWPSDLSRWSTINNDVTNHEALGRRTTGQPLATRCCEFFFVRLRSLIWIRCLRPLRSPQGSTFVLRLLC